jgi:transcriptional regulator with XRE-family HTH domain
VGKNERFGVRLKELREAKGWTLRRAADHIGISHRRLGELERGQSWGTGNPTRPSRETVVAIAEAYDMPRDFLLELAGFAREHADLTDSEAMLLATFRSLESAQQALALRLVRAIKDT